MKTNLKQKPYLAGKYRKKKMLQKKNKKQNEKLNYIHAQ